MSARDELIEIVTSSPESSGGDVVWATDLVDAHRAEVLTETSEAWPGELDHFRTLTTALTAAADAGNLDGIRAQLAAHQRIDTARRTEAYAANGGGR